MESEANGCSITEYFEKRAFILLILQGEVYVQFWQRPGEVAVELSFDANEREALVPEVLRGYL